MKFHNQSLSISPTDLSNFLSCHHRSALDLSAAQGVRTTPVRSSLLLERLIAMGIDHESAYVQELGQSASTILNLQDNMNRESASQKTEDAMRAGVDVIVQAALSRGSWYGRPDVLLKISDAMTGDWWYEPVDAKLALETRGGTIIQLGLYCELLTQVQGRPPERFHVVAPGPGREGQVTHSYRFQEYAAYFRLIKAKMGQTIALGHAEMERLFEPEPVDHCAVCPWSGQCRDWWRETDHLSLVAGVSQHQRRELSCHGISTVDALARMEIPFPFKPERGSVTGYEKVREQARVQMRTRHEGKLAYELIPPPKPKTQEGSLPPSGPVGLARLPAPCEGDVFLDLEGDSLAAGGGRDYLFGLVTVDSDGEEEYRSFWAYDAHEERRAFEDVIDLIAERLVSYPAMHVYHYAPYEPTALKRLMGRYATRADDVDRLLRGQRLVDLYSVVRQGVVVGAERYSIKNLEPLYDFEREVDLPDASRALARMELALELRQHDLITPEIKNVVEGYNRDDCVSTRRLRDWLEARRAELVASGVSLERPELQAGSPSDKADERAQEVEELRARLLVNVPDDPEERTDDQQARYQLAYLLDWHWREEKSGWWEYYRLLELSKDELLDEAKAVAGLEHLEYVGMEKRSQIHRFMYPSQDIEVKLGDKLKTQKGTEFGAVHAHDSENGFLDLVIGPTRQNERPTELIFHTQISANAAKDALLALGRRAAESGSVQALPRCAQRALLMREPPFLATGIFSPPPLDGEISTTDHAVSIITQLDRTVLAIQGPPGAGKTYTGARMILAAVKAGLKVGVTANSHKVIRNLLDGVDQEARRDGFKVDMGHKAGSATALEDDPAHIRLCASNADAADALAAGKIRVLGGTAWLWARPEFQESVDILFVDEAGQFALANVLAVARAADSLVLLGDPQQLEQPSKGSHPDGVGLSALQHILGESETMPPERGLFLPTTWRLAPSVCQFTSELFYAGKLSSKKGLEHQALVGGAFEGSGLWLREVDHDGNTGSSDEEADEVVAIVSSLLQPGVRWRDQHGTERPLTPADIRVVAPFNAHVNKIQERLCKASLDGVPTGTVDKFQGQEAPVAIYSMATSRPEDAPRGMEFLYSLNRLNVATSRARCAAIIVVSPRLFEPDCQTPRQMKLANALCRFREMAERR